MYIYIYVYKNKHTCKHIYIHHVPKCMSCHKAIVVITGRAHCFHDNIYIHICIYMYMYTHIFIKESYAHLYNGAFIYYGINMWKRRCIYTMNFLFRI